MTPDDAMRGEPSARDVVAVVPLRDGTTGKSRLATVLDATTRRRLVVVLARRVLDVLTATPEIDRIIVVTADPPFAAEVAAGPSLVATTAEITVVRQPGDRPGLNAALDLVRDQLREQRPATRMLVVHADLPVLTVEDVQALLLPDVDVVLAADRTRGGTNALAVDVATPFVFRFGADSLAAHRSEAEDRDLDHDVVDRLGSGIDLDMSTDWALLPTPVRQELDRQIRDR